jgi:hypothetical protein
MRPRGEAEVDKELERLLGIEPGSGAIVYFHSGPYYRRSEGARPEHEKARRFVVEARDRSSGSGENSIVVGAADDEADRLADIVVDRSGVVVKNRRGRNGVFVGVPQRWGLPHSDA